VDTILKTKAVEFENMVIKKIQKIRFLTTEATSQKRG